MKSPSTASGSEPAVRLGPPEPQPKREHGARKTSKHALVSLAFATLGVIYGDIGTSPLYAIRACFNVAAGGVRPTDENVFGVLSLIVWTLILLVSIYYVRLIMKADNNGEGGILALMSLATRHLADQSRWRYALVALGLFGASLLYGDGMITPAISVLGAVEGLDQATPALEPYIVPLAVVILIALFLIQRRGTAGVAALFSPITLVWFLSIAALGVAELVREPRILAAVNPLYGLEFLARNGTQGFLTLGFVFLVATGSEALYADMGHFGKQPIRLAWFSIVLPGLLLNYFGQGALLLSTPEAAENPFYRLVPRPLLYPMILVSTLAAVVASQALISGAFSLTRQAVQMGYAPRMTIRHTSGEREGQIYIPAVNWALMFACCSLVIAFGSSENLAAAYGVAVTATMIITSVLFNVVARRQLGWSPIRAGIVTAVFFPIVLAFFGANVVKIAQGGWFPLAIAAMIYLLMRTWQSGRLALQQIGLSVALPLPLLLEDIQRRPLPRVPGMAVFMNADPEGAPLVLLHHLKHNKMLHEKVVLLSLLTEDVPVVPEEERVETRERGAGFYQVTARYGFMETPVAPKALAASALGKDFKPAETTYYLGRQTLIPTAGPGMPRWRKKLFRFMARNARPATAYFGLPPNRVVELGAQVQF